jgi:hypothetical protein
MADPEPVAIAPLWSPEVYEPIRDADGKPVVASPTEYFAAPELTHVHPQGRPCHPNCLPPEVGDPGA